MSKQITNRKLMTVLLPLIIIFDSIIADQITKFAAKEGLNAGSSFNLIKIAGKEILNFTYVENRGASFGIFQGQVLILSVLTAIFIACGIYVLVSGKLKNKFQIWGLAFLVGGGLGNLIDRVFRGYVVDFIDFVILNFAVFNIADICAVGGTITIMCSLLFGLGEQKKQTEHYPGKDK